MALIPGTIYRNGSRYWWAVRLPGEPRRRARPLIPAGGTIATDDPDVARAVAASLWADCMRSSKPSEGMPRTVESLALAYLESLKTQYAATSRQPRDIRYAVECVTAAAGSLPVEQFGPKVLKNIRAKLVSDNYARTLINKRVQQMVRMFRWGVAEQKVPASTLAALEAVEGLRKGQGVDVRGQVLQAKEVPHVLPVHPKWVEATVKHAVPIVGDMIRLQLHTGMRSGELVRMRPGDIDRTGEIWHYRPAAVGAGAAHKTEHHGAARVIPLGPKSQKILKRYLSRSPFEFCFSAHAALKQWHAMQRKVRKTPVQPSQQNRWSRRRERMLRDFFLTDTYGQAVTITIERANAIRAESGLEPIPHWHPHQLRHTAATLARKELGRDAARAMLGQKTLGMVDLYAEIDETLAAAAAAKIG